MNPVLAVGQLIVCVALIARHPAAVPGLGPRRHVRWRLGRVPQPPRHRAPAVAVHDRPDRAVRRSSRWPAYILAPSALTRGPAARPRTSVPDRLMNLRDRAARRASQRRPVRRRRSTVARAVARSRRRPPSPPAPSPTARSLRRGRAGPRDERQPVRGPLRRRPRARRTAVPRPRAPRARHTIVGDLASTLGGRPERRALDVPPPPADCPGRTASRSPLMTSPSRSRSLSDPSYDGPGGDVLAATSRATAVDAADRRRSSCRRRSAASSRRRPSRSRRRTCSRDVPRRRQLADDPVRPASGRVGPVPARVLLARRPARVARRRSSRPRTQAATGLRPAAATDSLRVRPRRAEAGRRPVPYLSGIEFRYYDDAGLARGAPGTRASSTRASGLQPSRRGRARRATRRPARALPELQAPGGRPQPAAGQPTFRDPAVRQALLEAIDRNGILGRPRGLGCGRADALIPPGRRCSMPRQPAVAFDPTAAKAALTAAGWKQTDTSWIPKGATTRSRSSC